MTAGTFGLLYCLCCCHPEWIVQSFLPIVLRPLDRKKMCTGHINYIILVHLGHVHDQTWRKKGAHGSQSCELIPRYSLASPESTFGLLIDTTIEHALYLYSTRFSFPE